MMSATDRGSPRVTRPDKSPREDIETYRSMVGPKYDFPQPTGTANSPGKKGNSIKFKDDGLRLPEKY